MARAEAVSRRRALARGPAVVAGPRVLPLVGARVAGRSWPGGALRSAVRAHVASNVQGVAPESGSVKPPGKAVHVDAWRWGNTQYGYARH